MAAELGVLIVHGMGEQSSTFADELIKELETRLDKAEIPPGTIAWQRGYWADLLNQKEPDLWDRLKDGNDLDWAKPRRFFINAFGDAVAYRRAGSATGVYEMIHARMLQHLQHLRQQLGDADKPVVVLAHSLGGAIMSDYIWNAQSRNELRRGGTPLERMETLCGIVTFGCNIPLFTLALPEVEAIEFPPPQLKEPLKSAAKWINLYDPDDVLGWPLKKLSVSYGKAVTEDRAINVGNFMTSWNPMSHGDYWTDDDFTKPVVELLRSLLGVARSKRQSPTARRGVG